MTLAGDGTAIAETKVYLTRDLPHPWSYDPHQLVAQTDGDGHFAFERVRPGTWTLLAGGGDLIRETVPDVRVIEGEPTPEVEMALVRSATLEVALEGFIDDGRERYVWLQPLADPSDVKSDVSRPNGSTTFSSIRSGEYEVSVRLRENQDWLVLRTERITIEEGQQAMLRMRGP